MTANSPDSQANPKNLQSHIAFIARFRNFEAMRGMQGCYFTHLRAAAHFLQHLTCNDDGTELVRREASEAGESQGVASARSLRAATSWAASPKRLRCERFRRWRADGVLPLPQASWTRYRERRHHRRTRRHSASNKSWSSAGSQGSSGSLSTWLRRARRRPTASISCGACYEPMIEVSNYVTTGAG